jgi:hypothetical protein
VGKLSERQRLVLTIAVTVLVTGGLLALIFNDRGEIKTIEEEIASLDQRIQAADVEIRRTREREDRVLVFRAVEDRELAVLPTRQKIADFHRNLSTFLASAGLRFKELPESIPVESDLAKGIFVTRTVLSCQGDSPSLLKFLNMMDVKGLKVKAGLKDRDDPTAAPVHDIEVHLETYFYNPISAQGDQIHIPAAEARLQEPAIKEAIASFQPERPEAYVLRPAASRRDPLVDPRKARPSVDPAELQAAYDRESAVVYDLEARIRDINEKVELEKAFIIEGDVFKADRVAKEIDELLNELRARIAQVDQMKTVVIPELVANVHEVRERIDALSARRPPREVEITRSVAERTHAEVLELFENGQYAEVGSLTSTWNQYLRDKTVKPEAADIVELISVLRQKAKILADFQAFTIRVTGTIVDPVDPTRSVAVVNSRPLRSGDKLSAEGEVSVGRISRQGVEFVFRGETIFVPRQRGGGLGGADRGNAGSATAPGIRATR